MRHLPLCLLLMTLLTPLAAAVNRIDACGSGTPTAFRRL